MAFVRNHSNTSGPVGALGMYMQSLSIVLSVTIFVAVLPSAYAGVLFAWHPICMSIGYLGLMCEGISTACSARETDGVVRVQALWSHMWLQTSSTILTSLGFAAIYVNKTIHGKSHFTSLHGKLGSITYCLSLFLIVLGVCSFKRLKLIDRFPSACHPWLKWFHRLFGVTTWCLSLLVMEIILPHPAVLQGIVAHVWRLGLMCLGVLMLLALGRRATSALPRVVDFTLVPRERESKVH